MKISDVEPLINWCRERISEGTEKGHDLWWLEEELQDLETLDEIDDRYETVTHCEECVYYSHIEGEEPFCSLLSRNVHGWDFCSWGGKDEAL